MEKVTVKQVPTLSFAITTVVVLIAFIAVCISFFKIPVVVALFFSWLLLAGFAFKLGYSANEIEQSVYEMIKVGVGLFALLLSIGCMIAIWLSAGTVPTFIYWGLKLITPELFLCVAFMLCVFISMPTGTNWGTISTVGVAMMGVGYGMGINPGLVAGAVVSGACVGDLYSPVSDTPLLTATIAEVPILTHLKHAARTVVPGVILTAAIFLAMGYFYASGTVDGETTDSILNALSSNFKLGVITLIPLVVVIALIVMRQSSVSSIMIGSLVGAVVAILYQGYSITEVGTFLSSGFKIKTGSAALDPILNRGGISSMLYLIGMVVAALGMGGIFKGTGILGVLVESLSRVIKGRVGLIGVTFAGSAICSSLVAVNYFSLIMNATLMTPLYKKLKYRPENSSRAVTGFTDCISMMVPWSTNGVFIAATLGVPLMDIVPFMVFHIVYMLLEILSAVTGIGMTKYTDEEYEELSEELPVEVIMKPEPAI